MNTPTPPAAAPAAAEEAKSNSMTKAQAAKKVKRPVVELVDGKGPDGKPAKIERTTHVAVTAEEVLSFKDYGTHVVVVTTDGQKFSSEA